MIVRCGEMLAAALVAGALALAPVGCGSKGEATSDDPAGDKSMQADTPAALGDAAGQIYKDTMDAIVRELGPKPEPADAKAKLTALLDDAEKRLVELGKKREAMSPGDKATFDQKLTSSMQGLKSKTFDEYAAIASHYRKADREVGNLIAQANVLTQFANFELLKQQSPDAAKKHGIE